MKTFETISNKIRHIAKINNAVITNIKPYSNEDVKLIEVTVIEATCSKKFFNRMDYFAIKINKKYDIDVVVFFK